MARAALLPLLVLVMFSATAWAMRAPVESTMRLAGEQEPMHWQEAAERTGELNTYFFSTTQPRIKLAEPAGARRKGTTRLTVEFGQQQVTPLMPVVTASARGLIHNVANTWSFLKNYALQSQLVQAVNQKSGSQLYPIPAVSLAAASDLTAQPADTSVQQTLARLEAAGMRTTHTAPTNLILLPAGHAVGAVADVMSVNMRDVPGSGPVVTLTLDVVHEPHVISELQEHPKQTLDNNAHYHYFLPEGVSLDAAKFLSLLRNAPDAIQGLHAFAKGDHCSGGKDQACCDKVAGDPCTEARTRVWYTDDRDWIPEGCQGIFNSFGREKSWARTCTGVCSTAKGYKECNVDVDACFAC